MSLGRRVVVTGLGVVSPLGIGAEASWDVLLRGESRIQRIRAFDPSGFPSPLGAEVPEFTLGDYIPKSYRKSAKVMARDIQIAVVCAYLAVRDAGLVTRCMTERGEGDAAHLIDSTRFGANIGAGLICVDNNELGGAFVTARGEDGSFSIEKWGREGMANLTPLWMLKFLPNMLACHVTIVHDAQAPSNTITCGEASSHLAIGEAFRTIARGGADVCICGGAESHVLPMALGRQTLAGRCTTATIASDGSGSVVRPFSADGDGFVVGEGGGLVILEELESARRRGARAYAELVGFGASTDVHHWNVRDPSGRPVALAVSNALRDAGISASEIDLLTPQGAGIASLDAAETAGWRTAIGERLESIPAFTTRGAFGGAGAGQGAIDFSMQVLALHRGAAPPSVGAGSTGTSLAGGSSAGWRWASRGGEDARVRYAVSNGYSIVGGQHASLVIKRFEE